MDIRARSLKSVSPKEVNRGIFIQLGSRRGGSLRVLREVCVPLVIDDACSYQTPECQQLVAAPLKVFFCKTN